MKAWLKSEAWTLWRIRHDNSCTLPTKVHLIKAMVFPVVMYGCENGTIKKAERRRIDAFEPWFKILEKTWESLGLQGDPTSPSQRKSVLNIHWKDWCWSSNNLATWCKELLRLLSRFSRVQLCAAPRRQPNRLHCPWDSPGRNTGVGCHFLLQYMKVKSEREVTQLCLTLCKE